MAALVVGESARARPSTTPHFERFGREQGLPHNTVTDILEDRRGFIWFATDDGVARFDGYGFETYRTPPAAGRSNRIWALAEHRDDTLWAGGSDGLFRLDRAGRVLEPVALRHRDGRPAVGVRAIVVDNQGAVWVSSHDGLFRLQGEGGSFLELAVERGSSSPEQPALAFWAVAIAPDGTVWAKAGSGRLEPIELYRWRGDRFELALRARPDVYHTNLAIDSEGALWLNGVDPGESGIAVRSLPGEAGSRALTALVDDRRGTLWFGGFGALLRYDRDTGTVAEIEYERSPTWHQRWTRSLHRDRAGGLWLATLAGVYRLDPHRKRFRHLAGATAGVDGLGADAIGGLALDGQGGLWVGTMGAGLHHIDLGDERVGRVGRLERLDPLPASGGRPCGEDVWSIHRDRRERLWLATDSGLCVGEPGGPWRAVPLAFEGEPAGVFSIAESPPGRLWLTTTASRVARLEVATGEVRWFDRPVARGFGTWLVGGAHELWLGTSVGALVRVDTLAERFERRDLVPSGERREFMIYDLARNGRDRLWLATEAGLYDYRIEDGRAELRLASDSLPGSVVFSVLTDAAGRLWLGTSAGLVRFDPRAPAADAVRWYGLGDGVGNLEFNRYSRLASPAGELFFGGMTGLTRFRPEEIVDDPYPPPTVLSQVRVLDAGGERMLAPELLDSLVLEPGSHAVTFLLAALDFSRPRANRYAYRLEGFDPEWIDGGTDRSVRYTQLPPGRFVFRARSANGDGVGGGAEVALPVRVLPEFWQTTWFALLLLAATMAALALVHRGRVRRLLALQAVRLRIASDLHDELGTELAAIAFSTSLVERDAELGERERRRLEGARASTLKVMSGLRDVVWYVSPEHDSLASLALRMRSFADAALAGVEHRLEVAGDGDAAIEMNLRRQVYLIFKELVTNAARHARARRVEIRLALAGDSLRLSVADDGVGIDAATADGEGGTGLASVRRRATTIGGRFVVRARDGGGTEACVSAPRRRGG